MPKVNYTTKVNIPAGGLPEGEYEITIKSVQAEAPNQPELPIPVPEPPPPIVTDPPVNPPIDKGEVYARLKELFLDPSQWSPMEEVWEYPEPSGGVFVPFSRNEFMQQDRAGGKIRWFMDGVKRNCFLRDTRGFEIAGHLHDAKYHDGVVYAVVEVNKEIWIAKCETPNADKLYLHLDTKVVIPGATDTKHALEIARSNYVAIYGRLRHAGVDWPETDEIMGRRRGVSRTMQVGEVSGPKTVYFDPAKEQPGYEWNKIRVDYYATRLCHIEGIDVQVLSGYRKNAERIPSTRPERLAGTGPIIPLIALGREILSHSITPVNLEPLKRRTTWVEAHPYEPEVGQVYGVGLTYDPVTRTIDLYFNNRVDLHYLAKPSDNYPNCKVYRISAKL